jgi:hypothetical protein
VTFNSSLDSIRRVRARQAQAPGNGQVEPAVALAEELAP